MFLKISSGRQLDTLNTITISRSKILRNYSLFQKQCPKCQIWPVLKSNAYGHGLTQIATILEDKSFDFFIVDSYYEAIKIWQVSKRKVLIIGTILPSNFPKLNFSRFSLMVQDMDSLRQLARLDQKINIHLKINTGMNRQGIDVADIPQFISIIKKHPQITLEGLFSHLADADGHNPDFTRQQLRTFESAVRIIHSLGLTPQYCHLSATYGTVKIKSPLINAVRLGIGLYGFGPIPGLKPALDLNSHFTKIRQLRPGDTVSYNRTFTADKAMTLGIVPVGYYEALDRRLSNTGFVKFKNNFYPIAGRVCMNLTCINLSAPHIASIETNTTSSVSTPTPSVPKIFSPVNIISSNPSDKNSIQSIADICGTIPYEILVHLSESIRRVIIR